MNQTIHTTRTIAIVFVLLVATLLPATAQTTIRRVTTTGDAGNDGSSWAEAMTLQAALAASTTPGDQVWIATGLYTPHATDRTATFSIPAGVLVYGGFIATPANNTIASRDPAVRSFLSGDLGRNRGNRDGNRNGTLPGDVPAYEATRADNSHTVVTISGAGVTLDGLNIRSGEDGTATTATARNGAGLYAGAGTAGATIRNCVFEFNEIGTNGNEDYGGGAYFTDDVTLIGCTFNDNRADRAGAVYFQKTATLTDCNFTGNTAIVLGLSGGGTYFEGIATLMGCDFTNNEALGNGGGAYFDQQATLTNCNFTNNRSMFFPDSAAVLTLMLFRLR